MRYLTGKNTPKDTHSITSYVVNNEASFASVRLVSSEVKDSEILNSVKDITIKNQNKLILDPDFEKPSGFIENNPNTWGVSVLPKIVDESGQYWDLFKSKESLGGEKAVF